MRNLPRWIAALFLVLGGARPAVSALIDQCAEISAFKPMPYLALAANLQALPPKEAVGRLRMWAFTRQYDEQIVILCRMLFDPKPGSKLDRPQLGTPQFYGGTDMADWPLEPITVSDDVPFAIVIGYATGGGQANGGAYLDYCLSHATWTTRRYHAASKQQIEAALQKLLGAAAWKRPLTAWESGLLKKQTE